MSDKSIPVNVRILEKDYKIACPAGEHQSLLDSAEMLNEKMNEIKNSGKIIGAERIAVMAAINLAHELLMEKNQERVDPEIKQQLESLKNTIDSAIGSASS